MEEIQTDRSGQKSFASCRIPKPVSNGGELVLPGSLPCLLHHEVSIIGLLVRMKQHIGKAIGCWMELECLRPSIQAGESAIQSCDIFPIGSFQKDHASMLPERGTERRNPLKVPLLAMLTRISMCLKYICIPPHHKNTLQSTSMQRFPRDASATAKFWTS